MKSFLGWAKHRLRHKLEHFSLDELKEAFIRGGVPLLVIVVSWEIIEDIIFPVVFLWLGKNIHPVFYSGAPVSWLLCLHWLVVPIFWGLWIKFSKKVADRQ